MTLPGMVSSQSFAALPPPALVPKSFVFNGMDEYLSRLWATSAPNNTIFTYSMWVKPVAYDPSFNGISLWVSEGNATDYILLDLENSGDGFGISQDSTSAGFEEFASGITPDIVTGTWCHVLARYDSTQGTAANRIRLYVRGAQVTDSAVDQPTLNQVNRLFTNGYSHLIGTDELPASDSGVKRLAFIDCLEGVSADPSAFTFDNAGTLTRKPYVGSRGTYGFSLDGTNLFQDVSGNNQHFTGNNMDATNLNADVPPYVMV